MVRFLIQIECDGCKKTFEHESEVLFSSVSEGELAAFRAKWEKTVFHGIQVYACPTCQASAQKASAAQSA